LFDVATLSEVFGMPTDNVRELVQVRQIPARPPHSFLQWTVAGTRRDPDMS